MDFRISRTDFALNEQASPGDENPWENIRLFASEINKNNEGKLVWQIHLAELQIVKKDFALLLEKGESLQADTEATKVFLHNASLEFLRHLITNIDDVYGVNEEVVACMKLLIGYWQQKAIAFDNHLTQIKELLDRQEYCRDRFFNCLLKDPELMALLEGTCLDLDKLIDEALNNPRMSETFARVGKRLHQKYLDKVIPAITTFSSKTKDCAKVLVAFLESPVRIIVNVAFSSIRDYPLEGLAVDEKDAIFYSFFKNDCLKAHMPEAYYLLAMKYLEREEMQGFAWCIARFAQSNNPEWFGLFNHAIEYQEYSTSKFSCRALRAIEILRHTQQVQTFVGTLSISLLRMLYDFLLKLPFPFVEKANLATDYLASYCIRSPKKALAHLANSIETLPTQSQEEQLFKSYMETVFKASNPEGRYIERFAAKRELIKLAEGHKGLNQVPRVVKITTGPLYSCFNPGAVHYPEVPPKHILLAGNNKDAFWGKKYNLSHSGKLYVRERGPEEILYVCKGTTGLATYGFNDIETGMLTFYEGDVVYVKGKDGLLKSLDGLTGKVISFESCALENDKLRFAGIGSPECLFVCTCKEDVGRETYKDHEIKGLNLETGEILFELNYKNISDFKIVNGCLSFVQKVSDEKAKTVTYNIVCIDTCGGQKETSLPSIEYFGVGRYYSHINHEVYGEKLYYITGGGKFKGKADPQEAHMTKIGGYNLETNEPLFETFGVDLEIVEQTVLSPDGQYLCLMNAGDLIMISLEGDNPRLLWRLSEQEGVGKIEPKVSFTQDNKWLYSFASIIRRKADIIVFDQEVVLYKINCQTGEQEIYPTEGSKINDLVGVLPDGRPVLTGYLA